jgi:hypothetical protein
MILKKQLLQKNIYYRKGIWIVFFFKKANDLDAFPFFLNVFACKMKGI